MATASARRQPKRAKATIGFLGATNPKVWKKFVASFEDGLRDRKWVKGPNIVIKYEWADGKPERYASLAKKFVNDGVNVIVTSGTQAALAAKSASRTIPVVFASAGDPAHGKVKLVKSLKRPGGNVTGLSNGATEFAGRRIDELRKLVPDLQELAIMGNPASALIRVEMDKVRKEANARGIKIRATLCAPEKRHWRCHQCNQEKTAQGRRITRDLRVHRSFHYGKSAPRSQGGTERRLADRSRIS